jgi:DnaJ-domain-containing protein 1
MNGRLTDQPLVELIQEISGASGSGALRLARERARAVVYFGGGRVVAALSNLRALRLVEVLRRSGAVEEARLSALVREGASDEQAGLVLLRAGLLDEAALKKLNERRSKEVLREVLRWAEGEWSFDPRVRLAGSQQGACVEAGAFLVEAARALPPEFVSSRVGDEETLAPAADAEEKMKGGLRLLPTEGFVLSRVYGPMRLSDVVMLGGLPEEETRRAVYVLALAGLLERPDRKRAIPAEELRRSAAQRPAAEASGPQQSSTRPSAEREQLAPEPEAETRGTVEELLERARGETHYDVLGVKRSATADEVKRAYYAHARRLHPDRFRRDADEETRQRIDAAFARIAQAYETLKDANLRAAYDLKLSKKRG